MLTTLLGLLLGSAETIWRVVSMCHHMSNDSIHMYIHDTVEM
jgi:hypothetical protein